jgi:hypothetical protein
MSYVETRGIQMSRPRKMSRERGDVERSDGYDVYNEGDPVIQAGAS